MNMILTALIALFIVSVSFSGCDIGLFLNFKDKAFLFSAAHVFFLLAAGGAMLIQFARNRKKFIFPELGYQFISIAGLTLFSLLSHDSKTINGLALFLMIAEGVLVYFIVCNYVDSGRAARHVLCAFFSIFAFQGLCAIYQFLRPEIIVNPKIVYMGNVRMARPCGLLSNAGVFAVFMGMIWPIVFNDVLSARVHNFFRRSVKIAVFILGTGGVLVSLTRSAWIGVIISLFVVFAYRIRLKQYDKEFVIRSFLLILAAVLISNLFFPARLMFVRFLGSDAIGQLAFRWDLDKIALRMIRDYPLWGVGPGNFGPVSKLYEPHIIHLVHKQYLFWLAEYGLIGFLFFAWFVFSFIRISHRAVMVSAGTVFFPAAAGIGAAAWSLLIVNLSGLAMSHVSIFLLLCVLLGLDTAILRMNRGLTRETDG